MVTPRELTLMLQAKGESDKDVWFRTSWLATAVRETVWGKQRVTPRELLGWPDPAARQLFQAKWQAFCARLPRLDEAKH